MKSFIQLDITYSPPSGILYLTPEDQNGERKKFQAHKPIQDFLDSSNDSSVLSKSNFILTRRPLGLGEPYEIRREASANNSYVESHRLYSQFYTEIENSSPHSVACNLCDFKPISFSNFSKHMRVYHLPDENCPKCGTQFSAQQIKKHIKVCTTSNSNTSIPGTSINVKCEESSQSSKESISFEAEASSSKRIKIENVSSEDL